MAFQQVSNYWNHNHRRNHENLFSYFGDALSILFNCILVRCTSYTHYILHLNTRYNWKTLVNRIKSEISVIWYWISGSKIDAFLHFISINNDLRIRSSHTIVLSFLSFKNSSWIYLPNQYIRVINFNFPFPFTIWRLQTLCGRSRRLLLKGSDVVQVAVIWGNNHW